MLMPHAKTVAPRLRAADSSDGSNAPRLPRRRPSMSPPGRGDAVETFETFPHAKRRRRTVMRATRGKRDGSTATAATEPHPGMRDHLSFRNRATAAESSVVMGSRDTAHRTAEKRLQSRHRHQALRSTGVLKIRSLRRRRCHQYRTVSSKLSGSPLESVYPSTSSRARSLLALRGFSGGGTSPHLEFPFHLHFHSTY